MERLVAILFFFVLQWWIWRSPFFKAVHFPVWFSNLLFAAKTLGGVALFLLYTVYYKNREQADIFKFYDDGIRLHQIIVEQPDIGWRMMIGDMDSTTIAQESRLCNWKRPFSKTMLNENRLMIRMQALLSFVSFGNYQLHNLVFCFLSFLGVWCLTKTLSPKLSKEYAKIWALVLFSPSIILWTSGLLKEALIIFALGGIMWSVGRKPGNRIGLFAFLVLIFILAFTRTILAVLIMVALFAFMLSTMLSRNRSMLALYSGLYVVLFVLALMLPKVDPLYDYFRVISRKQHYAYEEARAAGANSLIELPRVGKQPFSLLVHIPEGFALAIVQPTIQQGKSGSFIMLNAIENLMFVGLFVYLIFRMRKPNAENARWFWLLFSVSVVYLAFLGLLVPVLGNLVRYKSVILPLFVGALLLVQKKRVEIKP